jgi:shikimate kinase
MNITLIGMAGAGKSTIGREIAHKLSYRFIDIDQLIEQKTKKRIGDIIQNLGEKKFKEIEEKTVLELTNIENTVISPGGSIVYSEKVMKFLKKISAVIWLDVSFENVQKRLTDERIKCIIGIKEKGLKGLFEERQVLYRKYADIIVQADNIGFAVKEIMKKIGP